MARVQIVIDTVDQSTNAVRAAKDAWQDFATPLNQTVELAKSVGEAVQQAIEIIKDAGQIQATANTFDHLAASIDSTSNSLLSNLTPATHGMVSDLTLMQAANQFLAMGLATTESEAAKLAQIGTTLGSAFRGDAAGGMEEFALLLANQSIPRLDTFGISATAVRNRIAELQAQTPGLSRETAFMTAVMEQAEITMAKVGDVSETAAGQLAILEASAKNAKDELKTGFAIGINPAITSLNELIEAATGAEVSLTGLATTATFAATGGFGPLRDILEGITLTIEGINRMPDDIGFLDAISSFYGIIPRTRELNEELDRLASRGGAGRGGGAVGAANAMSTLEDEIEAVTFASYTSVQSMDAMAAAHDQVEAATYSTIGAMEEYHGFSASTFIDTLNSTEVATLDVEQALLQQAAAAGADQTALVMLAAATGDYTEQQIGAALEMAALNAFIESQAAALAAGNITWQEALASIRAFRDELAALPDSKSVTVYVNTVGSVDTLPGEGPQIAEGATGGLVRGGTIARDSVPALLMPGERVLNREENRAFEAGQLGGGTIINNIYLNDPQSTMIYLNDLRRRSRPSSALEL